MKEWDPVEPASWEGQRCRSVEVCVAIDPEGKTGTQQQWTCPVVPSVRELWSKRSTIKHLSTIVTLINELNS